MGYLAKTTGTNLPGRGLINPAFVIKIVPATDNMQQNTSTGRDNPNDDYLDNLKIGTKVKADVNNKKVVGTVERIIKNELGDGVFVEIRTRAGKTIKVEGSRIKPIIVSSTDDKVGKAMSANALFNESRIMDFETFSKQNKL
jgi:hypothetical protein